jgi:hypothetical protein
MTLTSGVLAVARQDNSLITTRLKTHSLFLVAVVVAVGLSIWRNVADWD